MTATLHLVVGPAGSGKTTTLTAHARAILRRDPGSCLWLAPTHRAVADLRMHLARGGGVFGLRPITFADLAAQILEDQGPSRSLSLAQQRLLVAEIVADLDARGELRHFGSVSDTSGFIEGLVGLLRQLELAGVSATDFARAAYRRGSDGPLVGRRFKRAAISRKDRECVRLHARFQLELHRRRLHDGESSERRAAEVLRRQPSHVLTGTRAVFIDGFSDFTPARFAILESLLEQVEDVWISLLDEPGERAELFQRPRMTRVCLEQRSPVHVEAMSAFAPLPAGLAHLQRQLFRPLRHVESSSDSAGLSLIEAPGLLGEVRLVTRRIKSLLLAGVGANDIIVVARDIGTYADLLREVFTEYGVPLEVEGFDPLLRTPAIALLLRALRLPEEDFPFASVTALLRHGFFQPDWPELVGCPEMPTLAEALLRLLGEPRGRDAYLAAVARWSEREQVGLEDESAEEPRRKKIHELAKSCQPFLTRFFRAWDGAPERASLPDHLSWLKRFAQDLGIERADPAGLEILWREIDSWRNSRVSEERLLDRKTFSRRLLGLANSSGVARTPSGPGRVRTLSAPQARHLHSGYRFVLGLGERGFPRLAAEPSLLDEPDRESFARVGIVLPGGDLLSDEMLLFYQVISGASKQLILSYPAVDERGQEMLPGSFLLAVHDCFTEGAIPRERRTMLIEGCREDTPLSPAEYRVRAASSWPAGSRRLADDLRANLDAAAELVRLRFLTPEHGPYDGLFRDPLLIEWVGKQFGPRRVFSPTALEDYVACPFRFFLGHVLHLQPLEEPSEEIEVTRRGMAFHRALARLHSRLKDQGIHTPTPEVESEVLREISSAVAEDVARAPSPASKELWRLEGQRLLRSASRYPQHWGRFLEPWLKRGVAPRPHFFEVDFGLPVPEGQTANEPLLIQVGSVEARISGRIDRVDLADLDDGHGFWIIDYKTGRSSHYTGNDLAQYRRLQLTLYAVAVESVLLAGHKARPLGLAYWLVTENGPKVVLPGRSQALWLEDAKRWPLIREQLLEWVATLVQNIRSGVFALAPRSEQCTLTCPYSQVCRISQARSVGKTWNLPLPGSGE